MQGVENRFRFQPDEDQAVAALLPSDTDPLLFGRDIHVHAGVLQRKRLPLSPRKTPEYGYVYFSHNSTIRLYHRLTQGNSNHEYHHIHIFLPADSLKS